MPPLREGPVATKDGRKEKLAAAVSVCMMMVVITIAPGGELEGQRSKTRAKWGIGSS